mmetsp:Transcript_12478/g.21159  ORF Transcript_12478/g.21159 Transcript_12478/m.21159 type:complete len:216 (-) Transcript_12478:772-1419(-)
MFLLEFNFGVTLEKKLLILLWEGPHGACSHHYVGSLNGSLQNTLLNVRYPVLLADGTDLWGCLLVTQHGKVRPQMMLNLIVEESMKGVHQVIAVGKVDRSDHLTDIEGTGKWTTRMLEPVHIISCMIGQNGKGCMQVSQQFGPKQILDRIPIIRSSRSTKDRIFQQEVGERCQEEVDDKVGSHHRRKQLPNRKERVLAPSNREESHSTFGVHSGW